MTPRISFTLRKAKNSVRFHIQMNVAFSFLETSINNEDNKYTYLRIATGKRINLKHWDKKAGRPDFEYSTKDKLKLHLFLDAQQKQMEKTIQLLIDSPFALEITPDVVKEAFLKKSGKARTKVVKVSIVDDIDEFTLNGQLKQLTLNNYGSLVHRLRQFENLRGKRIYWHEFNQQMFDAFLDYLNGLDYAQNTLWGFQKRFIASFNRAKKKKLLSPTIFLEKRYRFKTPDMPYLNWEQVALVLNHKPNNDALIDIKTHFTVLALTGIRYSDLDKFYTNYQEGTAFNFSTFRLTKSPSPEVFLPALLPVKNALKDGFPPSISSTLLNLKLKVLCAQVLPYHIAKNVTCHSLRRSYISNFLSLSIIPEHVLAKLTGHSIGGARGVFHSYNKISLFENCQVMVRLLSAVELKQTAGIRLVEFVEQELMN